MPIVYKITNKTNNKSYVGYTVRTLEQRWSNHLSSVRQGSNFRFHNAIRKYGVDNWTLEILCESDDLSFIKKQEEEIILELNLTNNKFGYNAKPGCCGGWIVKPENYEQWRLSQKLRSSGSNNGNSSDISNDEIIDVAIKFYNQNNRIPSHRQLVKFGSELGVKIPKHFTDYRFDGSFKNLIKILEEKLQCEYTPHVKTNEHRRNLSDANKGKFWWSCDEIEISIQCKEHELDKRHNWYRGRKYGNKN